MGVSDISNEAGWEQFGCNDAEHAVCYDSIVSMEEVLRTHSTTIDKLSDEELLFHVTIAACLDPESCTPKEKGIFQDSSNVTFDGIQGDPKLDVQQHSGCLSAQDTMKGPGFRKENICGLHPLEQQIGVPLAGGPVWVPHESQCKKCPTNQLSSINEAFELKGSPRCVDMQKKVIHTNVETGASQRAMTFPELSDSKDLPALFNHAPVVSLWREGKIPRAIPKLADQGPCTSTLHIGMVPGIDQKIDGALHRSGFVEPSFCTDAIYSLRLAKCGVHAKPSGVPLATHPEITLEQQLATTREALSMLVEVEPALEEPSMCGTRFCDGSKAALRPSIPDTMGFGAPSSIFCATENDMPGFSAVKYLPAVEPQLDYVCDCWQEVDVPMKQSGNSMPPSVVSL